MKNLFILLVLIICAKANAQLYGDAYHSANPLDVQRAADQRAQATSDAHYNSINSTSTKSTNIQYDGSATNYDMFEKGYWDKFYADQAKRRLAEAENYRKQQAENDKYRQEQQAKENLKFQQKAKYINDNIAYFTNQGLTTNEAIESLNIKNFYANTQGYFSDAEYNNAAKSLENCKKNINSDTFDNLAELVWQGQRYPETATKCLELLKKKFPNKIAYLEEVELLMMSNYFGATEPFVNQTSSASYPKSVFELMTNSEIKTLFDRFDYLAKKFPAQSLKMAGACRAIINPYNIKAQAKYDFMSKDKTEIFEACKNVFFSENPKVAVNNKDYERWIDFFENRLRNRVDWVLENYPKYFDNLTPTDWAKIQKAQAMDYYYVWIVFRENKNKYDNSYAALKQAMKGVGLDKGPQSGQGSIFVGISERYEGNFENGKPNGLGKYYCNDGSLYSGNMKDGKFDGIGTMNWINNNSYTGQWKNSKLNGKGKYFESNGNVYEGDFADDKYAGNAKMIYKNGDVYEGTFVDDKRSGRGIVKFTDGTSYSGEWKDNYYDGEGTYTEISGNYKKGKYKKGVEVAVKYYNKQGKVILINEFQGETKSGFGTKKYDDGAVYEGNMENYIPNGKGKYTTKKQDVYEGDFLDDHFSGQGTMNYKNGVTYSGNWKNDKQNGFGLKKFSNKSFYEGQFVDNMMQGQGTFTYSDGGTYVGPLQQDEFVGQGVFTYANGTVYTGEFKDSKYNGKGIMRWKDGDSFEGEWKNDEKNGKGILKKANGNYKKGTFKKDVDDKVKYYNEDNKEISQEEYNKK